MLQVISVGRYAKMKLVLLSCIHGCHVGVVVASARLLPCKFRKDCVILLAKNNMQV